METGETGEEERITEEERKEEDDEFPAPPSLARERGPRELNVAVRLLEAA